MQDMSDDSSWVNSYKNRTIEYERPSIPPDNVLIDFHTKWFEGRLNEAATILANNYSVEASRVMIGQLPENVPSSYDIVNHIITISNRLVITTELMATFIESFFRHMASQKNWAYDKEFDEYANYERSEGGRLASRISHRFSELGRSKS